MSLFSFCSLGTHEDICKSYVLVADLHEQRLCAGGRGAGTLEVTATKISSRSIMSTWFVDRLSQANTQTLIASVYAFISVIHGTVVARGTR